MTGAKVFSDSTEERKGGFLVEVRHATTRTTKQAMVSSLTHVVIMRANGHGQDYL